LDEHRGGYFAVAVLDMLGVTNAGSDIYKRLAYDARDLIRVPRTAPIQSGLALGRLHETDSDAITITLDLSRGRPMGQLPFGTFSISRRYFICGRVICSAVP